jgi:hypothetical protein
MPWGPEDARRFTKKARSAKAKRQFSHVANSMLERTGDEGAAIRAANAVVKKRGKKRHGKRGRTRYTGRARRGR